MRCAAGSERWRASRRVALVTHQVNILALTGDNLAMGEAVVVQRPTGAAACAASVASELQ
jgi:hypothetical protein